VIVLVVQTLACLLEVAAEEGLLPFVEALEELVVVDLLPFVEALEELVVVGLLPFVEALEELDCA
jgi:hypothetical protein